MRDFLVFRLWAPMASWGDIAVGERRGSWSRPSRSAILGLVAAALGIERNDATAHAELEDGLGFAVRVDDPGRPLRDYHTTQSPTSRRGVRWATRRDELDPGNDLNTILSERRYYIEMDALIALWGREGKALPRTLAEIAHALAEPTFTLYAGRKACPLGLPLQPRMIPATTPLAAFANFDNTPAISASVQSDILYARRKRLRDWEPHVWLSEDDARTFELPTPWLERTLRRDGIRDRDRWLFSDRAEVRIAFPPVAEAPKTEPAT